MRVVRNLDILDKIILKRRVRKNKIGEKVYKIIKNVREQGDDALIEYTKRFDKVKLSAKELRVSETEVSAAFNELDSALISAFKCAIDNVTRLYKQQLPKAQRFKDNNGKTLILDVSTAILMPNNRTHCNQSRRRYGRNYREVHKWMDSPSSILGKKHRKVRHDST